MYPSFHSSQERFDSCRSVNVHWMFITGICASVLLKAVTIQMDAELSLLGLLFYIFNDSQLNKE